MSSLRPIATYASHTDALVAKSYLEAHDVPVFAHGMNHAANDWMMQTALQGVRLMTVPSALKEAQRLLRDLPPPEPSVEPPQSAEVAAGAVTVASTLALGPFFAMFIPIWRRWTRLFERAN